MRVTTILLSFLLTAAILFAVPQRSIRRLPDYDGQRIKNLTTKNTKISKMNTISLSDLRVLRGEKRTVITPVRDHPQRDRIEIISYEDEDALDLFLTMPDEFDLGDHSYNVRVTPEEAPFQLIGLQVILYDMVGEIGEPGMEVTIMTSDEDGFPDEEIVTFEVPFDDLIFSPGDELEWNEINLEDYNVEPVEFDEADDFHIVLNVIQEDEDDILAVIMDDGEEQPTDRSGFWNGEWEVWDLLEIVYEVGYNFAICAVVEYPDPVIVIEPNAIEVEGGSEFLVRIGRTNVGIERWRTELEIIAQPEEQQQQYPWIIYEPREGGFEQDDDEYITVTLFDHGFFCGLYEAELQFFADDRENPDATLAIMYEVYGFPHIAVEPQELNFGVMQEGPWNAILTISNVGNDLLVIDDITVDGDCFNCNFEDVFVLEIDESVEFTVTFTPEEFGEYRGTLTIVSNGLEDDNLIVPLSGVRAIPPEIAVNPLEIESVNQGDYVITIQNNGEFELRWCAEIEVIEDRERDNRGGPDEWGYEWRDNLEDDGPEFEWIDINDLENVREIHLNDNQISCRLDLDWAFPFYGEVFDQVFVCSDGWASFTRLYFGGDVPDFPTDDEGWFGTMLISEGNWHGNQNDGGPLFFWTNHEDMAIVTFNQWSAKDDGELADFQIILYRNGSIVYQYGDYFGEGNCFNNSERGSGVGINGLGSGQGFQFVEPHQGEDYLTDGRAIAFAPAFVWSPWIELDPSEGVIEADEEEEVIINVGNIDLEPGNYEANLNFLSNDPDNPVVTVHINLEVDLDVKEIPESAPDEFYLSCAYPNPFNSRTTINFSLPVNESVTLQVFNPLGHCVDDLIPGQWLIAGYHQITFDAGNLPAGCYTIRLQAGSGSCVQPIVILK